MSISFNGSTSKLQWDGVIASSYPASLFCWVKPTSAVVNQMLFGAGDTGATGDEIAIESNGSSGKMRAFERRDGGSEATNSTLGIQTTWQPVLVVFHKDTFSRHTIYYGSGAVVTAAVQEGADYTKFDRLVVGCRPKDGTQQFSGEMAEVAVWSSILTQANFDALAAGSAPETVSPGTLIDAWPLVTQAAMQVGVNGRVFTSTATTQGGAHPISRVTAAEFSFATTTALPTFSGSASVAGAGATITINDLRDLTTGTLRVSETGLTAIINNISTGALVVLLTGQILTAGGDLILTHASLVPGTWYRVTVILSDGSEGTWKYQAE